MLLKLFRKGQLKKTAEETKYLTGNKKTENNIYFKIVNLLDITCNDIPGFITKNWIEAYDRPGNAENRYKPSKQIRLKT